MADDEGLTRQQKIAWALVGLVLFSAVGGVIAETLTSGSNQYGEGGKFNASQGPEVTLGNTYNLSGGQLATDESINVSSRDNGWINASGGAGSKVTIEQINGTWTNVSSVSGSNNITLQPNDKNFTRVSGPLDSFKWHENISVEDGETDFIYDASGEATVIVETNASEGTQYGAIDVDSNTGLDVAVAGPNGQINFTEMPSGQYDVRIAKLGSLEIRNESEPHGLIKGATVQLKFFETNQQLLASADPQIEEFEDDDGDGSVELTGLEVNKQFIVSVKAANHHNRTVVIEDLAQQRSVFLPHKNRSTREIQFVVNDQTGDFGERATLTIQKTINRSHYNGTPDGFSWTNIAGDNVGSTNQIVVELMHEDRYRIKIENADGSKTRILGHHVVKMDDTLTMTIQDIEINMTNVSTAIQIGFEKDEEQNQVQFSFNDSEELTEDLEVIIYERGNRSNEIHNTTYSGPLGGLLVEEDVSAEQINKTWVVEFSGDRDGKTIDGQYLTSGQRPDIDITAIPDWVRHYASVFVILLIPTLLGGQRAGTAAIVATSVAAVLWWVQWTPPEISILSIILAATLAVGFKVRSRNPGEIA